jgi:hypothetical protein
MPPESHLGCNTIHEIPITPILRYQLETILQLQVLKPLETKVLSRLGIAVFSKKPDDWLLVFLATFILLHLSDSQVAWHNSASRVYPNVCTSVFVRFPAQN